MSSLGVRGHYPADENSVTDTELLHGLRDGDRGAGEELLARFEGPLLRYLRAAMPSPDAAEDAAQEVFLRLISWVRGEGAREVRALTPFVFTVARRLAIDAGRQWARRPRMASLDAPAGGDDDNARLADAVPDSAENARETAARRERDRHVMEALRELDEETREVITLRHIEGLSSKEVAEALGLAEGTVWSRLHRGLERLKQRLSPRPIPKSATQPRSPKP